LTSVMWALARLAMNVSPAGGMTRSAVPITAHDGMVFQAGAPDGSLSVLAASGPPSRSAAEERLPRQLPCR
jgi:hypothetical protein